MVKKVFGLAVLLIGWTTSSATAGTPLMDTEFWPLVARRSGPRLGASVIRGVAETDPGSVPAPEFLLDRNAETLEKAAVINAWTRHRRNRPASTEAGRILRERIEQKYGALALVDVPPFLGRTMPPRHLLSWLTELRATPSATAVAPDDLMVLGYVMAVEDSARLDLALPFALAAVAKYPGEPVYQFVARLILAEWILLHAPVADLYQFARDELVFGSLVPPGWTPEQTAAELNRVGPFWLVYELFVPFLTYAQVRGYLTDEDLFDSLMAHLDPFAKDWHQMRRIMATIPPEKVRELTGIRLEHHKMYRGLSAVKPKGHPRATVPARAALGSVERCQALLKTATSAWSRLWRWTSSSRPEN